MGGMDYDQFLTDILRKGVIYLEGEVNCVFRTNLTSDSAPN